MVESGDGSGPEAGLGSKSKSAGGRLRFSVELRPGETTIVSWKKLLKEGDGNSDEEDVFLDDMPDEDEYDTDDSFIDDAELDDYFRVDNSAVTRDGFFVSRGKLEHIEPTISTTQHRKKRRRKDLTKDQNGNDEHNPNKLVNKGRKTSSSGDRNTTRQSHKVPALSIHNPVVALEASPTNAALISFKKKPVDTQIVIDPSGLSNLDGIRQDKNAEQPRTVAVSSQNHNNKQFESSELRDTSAQRATDKSSHVSKSHSGKKLNDAGEPNQTIQRKEKSALVERFDLNVPASKYPLPIRVCIC